MFCCIIQILCSAKKLLEHSTVSNRVRGQRQGSGKTLCTSCSLYKPLQLCALVAKVRCLHKLELCDRTVCQGITAVLYFGQKAAAFCLLLCWKSKYIARQLACFVSKFDLTRVLLHMSLAAYTALDLVEPCSQPLPVTCNSTTTHAILLPVVSLSTSAARFTSVPNICVPGRPKHLQMSQTESSPEKELMIYCLHLRLSHCARHSMLSLW